MEDEPILREQELPHVLTLEYQYPRLQQMYKDQVAVFWVPEEINYMKDLESWEQMPAGVQEYIKQILTGFLALDIIVGDNIMENFITRIKIPEAQNCFAFQSAMERIHAEVYSRLLIMVTPNIEERKQRWAACLYQPCIKRKVDWALSWAKNHCQDIGELLVAFASIETIFFASSFCGIFWLKQFGWMPNLVLSNEFIARDEGMHQRVSCELYHYLTHKLPEERVHEIIKHTVQYECDFVDYSLSDNVVGLSRTDMHEYVRLCADVLAEMLGYKRIYNAVCPFPFMVNLTLTIKQNFFEGPSSRYTKAPDMGSFAITEDNALDF